MIRGRQALLYLWALGLVSWVSAGVAHAEAVFVIRSVDDPGEGFNDPTPVAPVGGNRGATLGEQRQIAVQYAADLWGAVLDSTVEIVIQADFAELGCEADAGAVLASAAPAVAASGLTSSWSDPTLVYPSALADRLQEADVDPGYPDIVANFNSSVDLPSCGLPVRWYYGLDGRGEGVDLVQATLHELAHGLGIAPLIDANTGALLADQADPFTALAYDHEQDAYLGEMSDGDRAAALASSRQIVFDGPRTQEAAQQLLLPGSPSLTFSPAIGGMTGLVSDTNFSPMLGMPGVTAPVIEGDPNDGCSQVRGVRDKIVLLRPRCFPDQIAAYLASTGAVGLLLGISEHWDSPPSPMDLEGAMDSDLPTLVISDQDADLLSAALANGEVEATMSGAPQQPIGADAQGRPLLNATDPVTTSMVSHWDMSVRPNLLMEPFVRPMDDPHGLDLTVAVLQDIGWEDPDWRPVCGNGELDDGEECDDGVFNSDTAIDACRRDCKSARCGDGAVDSGEVCDEGALNGSDNACRTDCSGEADCPDSNPLCVSGNLSYGPGLAAPRPNDGCGCHLGRSSGGFNLEHHGAHALVFLCLVAARIRRRMRVR